MLRDMTRTKSLVTYTCDIYCHPRRDVVKNRLVSRASLYCANDARSRLGGACASAPVLMCSCGLKVVVVGGNPVG